MAPKFDFLQAFIKTAAVSRVDLVWFNFTVKAFKMSWHIISLSPEEEETCEPASKVVCEECKEFLIDELDDGKYICWACRGNLKTNS